jgi:hypothetical protein
MWTRYHHPSCACGDYILYCFGHIAGEAPHYISLEDHHTDITASHYNDPASDDAGSKVGVAFGSQNETDANPDNITVREDCDILEGDGIFDMLLITLLGLMIGLVLFSHLIS